MVSRSLPELRLAAKQTVDLPLAGNLTPQQAAAARDGAGARKLKAVIRSGQPVEYLIPIGSVEFFAAMRKLILEEPQRCARMTGIE